MPKQHVPHMCLKRGICKHSDSERIRHNSGKNLSLLLNAVCDDWCVPHIPFSWCRVSSFYGQFTVTRINGEAFYEIRISSTAYAAEDSRTPFFKRTQLVETILHELAHYIDVLMRGTSDHSASFNEILQTLRTVNYTAKLVEVE
jgi:hypothetical protein